MSLIRSLIGRSPVSSLFMLCSLLLLLAAPGFAASQPMTKQTLTSLLQSQVVFSPREIVRQVKLRGVDFRLQADTEQELRKLGAVDRVIDAVRASYRPAADGEKAGGVLSKAAIQKLLSEQRASEEIGKLVETRGVDFMLTPETGEELSKLGGNRALLGAIAASFKQAGPSYDDLIVAANTAMAAKQYDKAVEHLEQAAKLDPESSVAYEYLTFLRMTFIPDTKWRVRAEDRAVGEKNARQAIESGGEAAFMVIHKHNSLFSMCGGFLFIRKSSIAYVPLAKWIKSKDDSFDVEDSDVIHIKALGVMKADPGTLSVKVKRQSGEVKEFKLICSVDTKQNRIIEALFKDYK